MIDDRTRALTALAAERWRVSLWLTAAMMLIYFGFNQLTSYAKSPLMWAKQNLKKRCSVGALQLT